MNIEIFISSISIIISMIALFFSYNQLKLAKKLSSLTPFIYLDKIDFTLSKIEVINKGPGHAINIKIKVNDTLMDGDFNITGDDQNKHEYYFDDDNAIDPMKTQFIVEYESNSKYKFKDIWLIKSPHEFILANTKRN